MATAEQYPWLRQDKESSPAYGAFRIYLEMGDQRSLTKVMHEVSKSWALISGWSSKNEWIERVRAFDRHLKAAETDGLVSQLAESRDKNLALMDKLRGHLDRRLDVFIERNADPTMLWTQALTAMAKVEQNSLLMGNHSDKTSDQVLRVEELVEKLQKEIEAKVSGE